MFLRKTPQLAILLLLAACNADWQADDVDGDGISILEGDCWDRAEGPEGSGLTGAQIFPGATETWYDGYDQDCGGDDDYDADADGFVLDAFVGATTYGLAGTGDLPGGDCWDDPDTLPDGFIAAGGNPQLAAGQVNPGQVDSWYDGIDQDCDGADDFDQDVDGFASADHPQADGTLGADCDDLNADVNPDATEICDLGIDNDCDGLVDGADDSVDEDSILTWYQDLDDDDWGNNDVPVEACDQPKGYVAQTGDCEDEIASINPGADEVCNDIDDDCDHTIDEAAVDAPIWYIDADQDDYGSDADALAACDAPVGFVDNADDCNDADPDISPGDPERCATVGIDDDCDGEADEDDAIDEATWFSDLDDDGYGLASLTIQACTEPLGFAALPGDCDDTDDTINPGADELCSTVGVDDDCDGEADEDDAADAPTWTIDGDMDGYGRLGGATTTACDQPDGYVDNTGDCNDDCDVCWTGATEVCNDQEDNDCDGTPNDCAIDAVIDLATDGLVVSGESSGDELGLVLDVGDLDGDGQQDLVVGARNANNTGRAYVVLGPVTGDVSASAADLRLDGESSGDKAGRGVAFVNLDGDDYDDVVVGATTAGIGNDRGAAYVIYGPASGNLDLGSADWMLEAGSNYTYLGRLVVDLGDVDGDGFEDFGIGTTTADIGSNNDGAIYVVGGVGTGSDSVESEAMAVLYGASSGDNLSRGFDGAGDVDGDGVGDVIAGAWGDDTAASSAGAAYLFLGPLDADRSAADADATWTGETGGDFAGDAVAGGRDVDGDGRPDMMVGAYLQGSAQEGAAYLLLGSSSPTSGSLGDAAAIFRGEDTDQQLGINVALIGDLDMDGDGDVAIGDGGRDNCNTDKGVGHTWVFYGGLAGTYSAGDADVMVSGAAAGDCAGARPLGATDITGDDYPDLIVGAPGGEGNGAAYIVEGVGF